VVHVVYRLASENISDAQIQSQINILNEDFRKLNPDFNNTPAAFQNVAADCDIQFVLAKRNPNGDSSTGITRTQTTVTYFNMSNQVKYTSTGGNDAWPANQYLNIWVCRLSNGLLGYAQFPGGAAATDGVVCSFRAFGNTGAALPPFNKGRTATHEIAHWLNVYHIWGDDAGSCNGSDLVGDTPNQGAEHYGCPSFPSISCNNGPDGAMFMNFMDFTNDASMGMFTEGQKNAMRNQFSSTGKRNTFLQSKGLSTSWNDTPASVESTASKQISIYPNPVVSGSISINLNGVDNQGKHFAIVASNGQIVKTGYFQQAKTEVNVSAFPPGIYQVRLTDMGSNLFAKFVKQ